MISTPVIISVFFFLTALQNSEGWFVSLNKFQLQRAFHHRNDSKEDVLRRMQMICTLPNCFGLNGFPFFKQNQTLKMYVGWKGSD